MWEQQRSKQMSSMVSGAQTIENFNANAYESMHRLTQNVLEQRMHRNSETDCIDHKQDDSDQSTANRLIPNTFDSDAIAASVAATITAATNSNSPSVGDDFVDNVSSSEPNDATTSCLRKRITKNARKSSPKMHCNNKPPSLTASTCEFMHSAAKLRHTSAGYDRNMSALHRPQFASGAKLKKIVFNGTFPIDDPYSSRFDYDGHLLQ